MKVQESSQVLPTEQQFEEKTHSALTAVCRSKPQTYNQFMANFTQLKPEDLKKAESKKLQPSTSLLPAHPASSRVDSSLKSNVSEETFLLKKSEHVQSIEEEVLEKGTVTQPYLMRSDENSKSLKVKLGNFVDSEDIEDCDDNDDDDSYLPSFNKPPTLDSDSNIEKHETRQTIAANKNNSKTITIETPPSENSDSHSTNKLESTINAKKMKSLVGDDQLHENAAKTMALAAVKRDYKSEENLLQLIGQDDDLSDASDLEYDPDLDLPNPGEIVEEPDGLVRDCVTKLNFTTRQSNGTDKAYGQQSGCKQNCDASGNRQSEEIHAFSLDGDFDYDNVVLSPKYNEEEMAIILNAMKGTAQEQASSH